MLAYVRPLGYVNQIQLVPKGHLISLTLDFTLADVGQLYSIHISKHIVYNPHILQDPNLENFGLSIFHLIFFFQILGLFITVVK